MSVKNGIGRSDTDVRLFWSWGDFTVIMDKCHRQARCAGKCRPPGLQDGEDVASDEPRSKAIGPWPLSMFIATAPPLDEPTASIGGHPGFF